MKNSTALWLSVKGTIGDKQAVGLISHYTLFWYVCLLIVKDTGLCEAFWSFLEGWPHKAAWRWCSPYPVYSETGNTEWDECVVEMEIVCMCTLTVAAVRLRRYSKKVARQDNSNVHKGCGNQSRHLAENYSNQPEQDSIWLQVLILKYKLRENRNILKQTLCCYII